MIYNLYSVVHLLCKPQRWSDNYYESLAHKHFCDLQFFIKQEFTQMKKKEMKGIQLSVQTHNNRPNTNSLKIYRQYIIF